MTLDQAQQFKEWGEPLPSRQSHGSDDDIRSSLKSVHPTNWRLEGNRLIADTEMGELSQTIPTSHILIGTDDKGLPVFREV